MRITILRIARPQAQGSLTCYELPDIQGASISNVLQHINRRIDGSMAYYLSCRRGMCAACVVRVNGKNELACVTLATDGMVIEPAQQRLVIKDTVVNLGMPKDSELPPA
jgi:succinate dehydrogenase/fumarate reductase-like Fe-S protein